MTFKGSIVHGRTYEDGPFYPFQYVPPGGEPSVDVPAYAAELAEHFRKAARGRYRLLTPLPRRTRLRLAAESAVNRIGIWLVGHGHFGAAKRLWRL